ncbi:DUF3179 domain-containing protein [Candidatus Woesearchaeota archaeon]|nr:MAG: DUF3179 domain-containing protein [Candidatus Woesearchaeota archaeon]
MKRKTLLPILVSLTLIFIFIFSIKPRTSRIPSDAVGDSFLDAIKENYVSGGVEKDGIPSIDEPKYISAMQAEAQGIVRPDSIVLGVERSGETFAYPESIMYWHEVVNEKIGGEKLSITYCPLTESAIGYAGVHLGVSGKLYNSNLVLYDRKTQSTIPQILGIAVDGLLKGRSLKQFPIQVTKWEAWRRKHPETKVLSRDTGYARNYDKQPYPGYDQLLRLWFPVAAKNNSFHTKEIVYGISRNYKNLAVIDSKFGNESTKVKLGNETIEISRDKELGTIKARVGNDAIPAIRMYWFAWYAYHPDTLVLSSDQ